MTEIKDGIYAQVSGTVSKRFQAKNGEAAVIEIAREGSQYPDRVAVWSIDFQLEEGDRVALKGWLSWRKEIKDDKTYFNVAMNKAQLVERVAAVQDVPPADEWPDTEATPF